MIHSRKLAGIATIFVALIVSASVEANEPKPIAAEPLTQRHAFDGDVSVRITQKLEGLPEQTISFDDASHITVVRFTIQPGAVFPWHTHPGTVLITVTEGEFEFIFAEDCVNREYGPGDALVDPGNSVHTALNPSRTEETVVVAVLLGAPAEGALTIPVEEERNAALDAECGINRN
jgi:quercetin dioxygenase-like cupin family protein